MATISSGDEGETAATATVREEDEATRERRRQSMARRRSWGDFGTAQREEDSNGGQLEDTRGVQSLDTDPKQQEQQQQHRQQHLNPHQHAFSRGSRLRSTWTFGNKKLNQQVNKEIKSVNQRILLKMTVLSYRIPWEVPPAAAARRRRRRRRGRGTSCGRVSQ